MRNLELDLLTARAALPRAQRGTTVAFVNGELSGQRVSLTVRGRRVVGTFREVHATAHGLVAYVTVGRNSESAPLAQIERAN